MNRLEKPIERRVSPAIIGPYICRIWIHLTKAASKASNKRVNSEGREMSVRPPLLKRIGIGLVVILSATGPAIHAQTAEFDALQEAAADPGAVDAQLQLGEILLYGNRGLPQDKDRGMALISQAAAADHTAAQAVLGKVLLDGFYVEADPERGVRLLRTAADKGNLLAEETLGQALLWGVGTPADPGKARDYLSLAAQKGSPDAMRTLGEQLISGRIMEQDLATGVQLLERAVDIGDAEAKVALGTLLFFGGDLPKDRPRATALFKDAAMAGNGEGLLHLGADMMWRQKDRKTAKALLIQSGELGTGAAWATLAEGAMFGYLGKDRRGQFETFAEKARAAGEPRIAKLEALRQLYGINMRASGPDAIDMLEQASEDGNPEAAKFLIQLVRDGNRLNVRKSPKQATKYLERYSHLLDEADRERLEFTLKLAGTRRSDRYDEFLAEFKSRPDLKSTDFGMDIFASNPNFAIFVLQSRFKQQGKAVGPLDGYAGPRTLKALWNACRTLPDTEPCQDTVMLPRVIGALLAQR
ncbi:tetratricopeptide repeat protein [Pseudophaeobacter sp. C1-32P7]|uniref:tetratricopeptide repeat protein n=1 Tax=Pseudophaeobacter sp. C1-32P7 TaxID=3098142 RepID=UPI0034D6188D